MLTHNIVATIVPMPETIISVGNNLYQLIFQCQGQLDDENLGVCGNNKNFS